MKVMMKVLLTSRCLYGNL